MDFWEKLSRLTADRDKGKVSFEAGLTPRSISNYISRRQLPRADAATGIARALGVSVEWLVDDSCGWPPPEIPSHASAMQLGDDELMLEVARRYRLAVLRLLEALDKAEKIDWAQAEKLPFIDVAAASFPIVYWLKILNLYNPDSAALAHHEAMPGGRRPMDDFKLANIVDRINAVMSQPGFEMAAVRAQVAIPKADLDQIEADLQWAGARFDRQRSSVQTQRSSPPTPPPRSAAPPAAPETQLKPPSKTPQTTPPKPSSTPSAHSKAGKK